MAEVSTAYQDFDIDMTKIEKITATVAGEDMASYISYIYDRRPQAPSPAPSPSFIAPTVPNQVDQVHMTAVNLAIGQVTTFDQTPPTFQVGTVSSAVSETSLQITLTLDEPGTIWCQPVRTGFAEPSINEILQEQTGVNHGASGGTRWACGGVARSGSRPEVPVYDIWCYAEDDNVYPQIPNGQKFTSGEVETLSTLDTTPPILTIVSAESPTSSDIRIKVKLDEPGTVWCNSFQAGTAYGSPNFAAVSGGGFRSYFDPSIYVLCLSLATHVRVPPPFGQVPPLLDVFIVYFQCFSPFCSLLFGTLALCYRSPTWLLSSASCAWAAFGRPCWPRRGAQRPARPWLTMLHPYFYWFYRRVPGYGGGEVHIERLWPSGLEAPIDVWYEAGAAPPRPRPILLNVHGGAWRGGEARISPQAPIWQTLAAQGFLIVSCEYRRRRAQWPDQLDDCRAALMWLVREGAAQFHGDLEDLTIAGASAGGHLVALLLAEAVKKQLPLPVTFRAALLFYPALDPADRCGSTVRLPFSCSLLGVRYQMSALDAR
eukprot:g13598.t1